MTITEEEIDRLLGLEMRARVSLERAKYKKYEKLVGSDKEDNDKTSPSH